MADPKNILFFIGAGFTKAIAETAPTGEQFLIKAFDPNGPSYNNTRIKKIKKFIEKVYHPINNDYPNFEDVLSLVDYTIQRKEALSNEYLFEKMLEYRNDLIFLIGKVIKDSFEKSSSDKIELGRHFVKKIVEFNDNKIYSIISTNYDIILDNSLLEIAGSCNYGFRLRKNIYLGGTRADESVIITHEKNWSFEKNNGLINRGKILLLKIHGSLNWFYCPKCKEIDITIGYKGTTSLTEDQNKYICINTFCTSNYEPLIVTPTMLKVYDNPFLQQSWKESEKVIKKADCIIFIGYSLNPADYHIRSLLTKAICNNRINPKILIIEKKPESEEDENWNDEVKKRYSSLFGSNIIDFQPIGLKDFIERWSEFVN